MFFHHLDYPIKYYFWQFEPHSGLFALMSPSVKVRICIDNAFKVISLLITIQYQVYG